MKTIIGIDPGLKGGMVRLVGEPSSTQLKFQSAAFKLVQSIYTRSGKEIDWSHVSDTLSEWLEVDTDVFVERVHAMPGQGVSSSFSFGVNYGGLIALCQALRVRAIYRVEPRVWKAQYGLTKQDKKASIALAQKLFKTEELKTDGLAEAALIAGFGWGYTEKVKTQ